MIFYTLKGPKYRLEIHDDKIKLVKKKLWRLFSSKGAVQEWKMDELAKFEITKPKFIWGKLEWATEDGAKAAFRFSTNAQMMNKIEKYMHKLIIKNFQKRQAVAIQKITPIKAGKKKRGLRAA